MKKKSRTLVWFLVFLLNIASGWYIYHKFIRVQPSTLPPVEAESLAALPPSLDEAERLERGPLAKLTDVERNVSSKRAVEEEWRDAQVNMDLYEADSVRTFLNSSAVITFDEDDEVVIDSNTLLVIQPPHEGTEREIAVAVIPGQIVDAIKKKPAAQQKRALEEEINKRKIRLRPVKTGAASGKKSRSVLKTLPDQTTLVQAIGGPIEIIGPKGDVVILKDQNVTRVGSKGTLASPRMPLEAPKLVSPGEGKTVVFQSRIPKIDLKWSEVPRAWRYRVLVAADKSFKNILADEVINGTNFTIMNLSAGTYYWRVNARESDGFMSVYSAVRSLKAVFDDKPPKLSILSPPEMYVSPVTNVELRGKTERGAKVKVNGQKVSVARDGTFVHSVVLKEGVNLITVEASDAVGNRSYGKRLLTYKGRKRSGARTTSSRP